MVQPQDIKAWIEAGLPGATAVVSGDGEHFEAVIVCAQFAGKTMVQQHQLVYRALGERMRAQVHALSMRTLTPAQWAEETGGQPEQS